MCRQQPLPQKIVIAILIRITQSKQLKYKSNTAITNNDTNKNKPMIREIVTIDEDLCNGCGECVPNCHEGALQIIDGKARLISDLMCDGLGACIGYCPQGAIAIEKREAAPYDEIAVMKIMVDKGQNTVIAHLKHLKDHNETVFLKQAVRYLQENAETIKFDVKQVIQKVHSHGQQNTRPEEIQQSGGCPGSREMSFNAGELQFAGKKHISGKSELKHWPVQLHLVSPQAAYFQKADVLIAADCVAFAIGNFHQDYLKGKSLAIACPKLDDGLEIYTQKIQSMIDDAQVNTITVMIMQVPCCSGLLRIVQQAISGATRKVPVKTIVVSVEGNVLQEEWM